MITLPKIIDAIAAIIIRKLERKPDNAGEETTNDILRFRSQIWMNNKHIEL